MITKEEFRRKCDKRIGEGNPFIGIAYFENANFLFMYTGSYESVQYHYSYVSRTRYGTDRVERGMTSDVTMIEAMERDTARFREFESHSEVHTGKARKSDITKLRKWVDRMERIGKLNFLVEFDGKAVTRQIGDIYV